MIVLKHISARNLKNTLKLSKNVIWSPKTTMFEKKFGLNKRKVRFVPKGLRPHTGPYGPEKSPKMRKELPVRTEVRTSYHLRH